MTAAVRRVFANPRAGRRLRYCSVAVAVSCLPAAAMDFTLLAGFNF